MFNIYIRSNITADTVQTIMNNVKSVIRDSGFITINQLLDLVKNEDKDLDISFIDCPKFDLLKDEDGWDDGNLTYSIERHKNGLILSLKDPKLLNNNKEENDDEIFSEVLDLHKKLSESKKDFDPIHRPAHYAEGRKYEPRKVIADWDLNFNLGNAVKYISRAGRKNDKTEDLKKAIQYLEFEIEELLEKENENE